MKISNGNNPKRSVENRNPNLIGLDLNFGRRLRVMLMKTKHLHPNVKKAAKKRKHRVVMIGVYANGRWVTYEYRYPLLLQYECCG